MRNHLCWEPRGVRAVINPYAEHIPDSLFRAVHSDWGLQVTPPVGQSFQEIGEAAWTEMTPVAFLGDFLSSDRPHVLAVILGKAGSGKSHLVHWMRLHLREDERHMVLVVRKSGTSLRAIVRDLIYRLPRNQQQSFLDIFNSAGDGIMNREGQKHELLNHLAQVIRNDTPMQNSDEVEEELLRALPHLLQDPYMREQHFLQTDGVVEQIVEHIFAESNASNRPDNRREFTSDDLNLGGMDFVSATHLAREAIQIIDIDPVANKALAIDIINRNLDKAVARTLSFSGDRVEELMARLRAYLKSQGRELVLLVEEFARLQGIDRALLQAITTHGDERLCRMRTAIAVTTGFFESVAETAYMRTTHVVDMNRSAGRKAGETVTHDSLAAFAARYLNAVRLGVERIEHWSRNVDPGQSAPSHCETCNHRSLCHDSFGVVDGYGLYPFTDQALWIGAQRVDSSMPGSLNPRVLQNNLLVEVLDNHAQDISDGTYPPERLLEKLGGVKGLDLASDNELLNRDRRHYERRKALLELYDGSGNIVNLSASIHTAFDIPQLTDAGTAQPIDRAQPTPARKEPLSQTASSADDERIESWIRGSLLDQSLAYTLRTQLYSVIVEALDWDLLGLARSSFVGQTGKPFRQTSIRFERQSTQAAGHVQVALRINADVKTGQALQGLLRASKNDFRWDFDGGDRALSAFLDCLEIWRADVTAQLQRLCAPTADWNQAEAAIQLLCLGAAMGGGIRTNASEGDVINALFKSKYDGGALNTKELRDLQEKINNKRDHLIKVAHSQISSLKGGQAGAMIDPRRVLAPIRALRKDQWRPTLQPVGDDMDDVAKLYRTVVEKLPEAVAAEQRVRAAWFDEMEEAFGATPTRKTIMETLSAAKQAALDGGVPAGNTSAPLDVALEQFSTVQFDNALQIARSIAQANDALAILPTYGRGHANAVEAGRKLSQAARTFLDTMEKNLDAYSQEQAFLDGDLAANIQTIERGLGTIIDDLTALNQIGEQSDAS